MEDRPKRLAALLHDGFADWEIGLLAAGARRLFGARVAYLTPEGRGATSIGGLRVVADGAFAEAADPGFDALVLCGSDAWTQPGPDLGGALRAAVARGAPVGAICGGTVAAARAGLFAGRAHTSNDRAWLAEQAPGYAGAGSYVDAPEAVTASGVVSAAGTAPAGFALGVLGLLYPDRPELAEARRMLEAMR